MIMNVCVFSLFVCSTWQSIAGQEAETVSAPNNPGVVASPNVRPTTTVVPTAYPEPIMSSPPTRPPTLFPTLTRRPSDLPSQVATVSPSNSNLPSTPPSFAPSLHPTFSVAPSKAPSTSPAPSQFPSATPTDLPSKTPSTRPTDLPSESPTNLPTVSSRPSEVPSISPSLSLQPSDQPSNVPTHSLVPSISPSYQPSDSSRPSVQPSLSSKPSLSGRPSSTPSTTPSFQPSISIAPSLFPSASHAPSTSSAPSRIPSHTPSDFPSDVPTVSPYPSSFPSLRPTEEPSVSPSAEPSSLPSTGPTFTPVEEVRDVGMYITGLVNRFQKGTIGRQFEQLISRHTMYYWETVVKGGTVVYNVNTEFVAIRRTPRGWQQKFLKQELPSLGARRARQPQTIGIFGAVGNNAEAQNHTIRVPITNETIPSKLNGTLSPLSPFYDINVSVANGTIANETFIANETEHSISSSPTFTPTASISPSGMPSLAPSVAPSISDSPSLSPTVTYTPSSVPSPMPELTTWVIWYTQNITYGERFAENDTRANSVWEVFSFPFLLDQKVFTNEFINITKNQLPMYVVEMEIRDGSEAPSIQPSEMPSAVPSDSPTTIPTVSPTPPPSGGIGTTGIIIAVVVPVMVVLLIAFAGIIYVTRVEHEDLEPNASYIEDVVVSAHPPLAPRTLPPVGNVTGNNSVGLPADEPTSASFGTPGAEPLIDATEILQAAQQQQLQPTDIPPGEVVTTPRRPSGASLVPSVSGVSEMTTDDRKIRRIPGLPTPQQQGTPGYISPTGTFTPSITPIPVIAHSREPSLQGSDSSTPLSRPGLAPRAALTRAQTTGGIDTDGRLSPFGARGGIPTIPTAQLGVPDIGVPDIAAVGGAEDPQVQDAISESEESASEDHPSMTAFNLQIQDLDDL